MNVTPPSILDTSANLDTSNKPKNSDKTDTSTSTDSTPGVSNNAGFGKSKKSSGTSIGLIIGVIAGVIVVASAIILGICCYKKRKKKLENKNSINESSISDTSVGRSQNDELITGNEFELEPNIQNDIRKSKILLETTSQAKIQINFDPNKPAKELIKFYFKKIKRLDLYGDPSIRFLLNANLVAHDSNELLQKFLNKKSDVNIVVIDDLEEKIKTIPNESNNS